MRQLVAAALLLAASLNTFGQPDKELVQPSVEPSAAERLLDNVARLLSVDSLAVAALEKDERFKFELAYYGTWFIPNPETATSYAVVSAFDGTDLRSATLVFRARFAPSQYVGASLHLPLKREPDLCVTQALVRNRFGAEQGRGRTPHVTTLSYTAKRVSMTFAFNGTCAGSIHFTEATPSAQITKDMSQDSAPSSKPSSNATIPDLLTKLVSLQGLSPGTVRTHLQTRIALSSAIEYFGILQRRETHYQLLDLSDDKVNTASLSLRSPLSSPATQNATLRLGITRPLINCTEPMDLTKLGAAQERTNYNDGTPSNQTFRTQAGLTMELTYARGCISTIVLTHQTVRK